MIFKKSTTDDLDQRFSRLVSGMLTESEMAELEEILIQSPAARDAYRHYLAIHLDMVEHFQQTSSTPQASTKVSAFRFMPAIAAICAVMAGLAIWMSGQQATRVPAPTAQLPESRPVLAIATLAEGVRWNLGAPPAPGSQLPPGPISLDEGLLALDLIGGQSLTIRGPAHFELIDSRKMRLDKGEVALHVRWKKNLYAIRVPHGTVVDLGTEFSVKVNDDGVADVWVFQGQAAASRIENETITREEIILKAGQSIRISRNFEPSPLRPEEFLRRAPDPAEVNSPAGDSYAQAVAAAKPLAWWRFEEVSASREIPAVNPESPPLILHGKADTKGTSGHRYLYVDMNQKSGFAATEATIAGLDGPDGSTIECLLYPEELAHMSALTLEEPSLPSAFESGTGGQRHEPSRALIERMGRNGTFAGHSFPDYALRALVRTPSGYSGGFMIYSALPQPVHAWTHVVCTRNGDHFKVYINGRLSDQTTIHQTPQQALLRPIIGRSHPLPQNGQRQWVGGIDEVALYGRELSAEEAARHFAALDQLTRP